MPALSRSLIIALSIAAVFVLLVGFAIGRATSGDSDADALTAAPDDTTSTVAETSGGASSTTTQVLLIDGDPASVLPPNLEIPESGIPVYGSDAQRAQMLSDLAAAGVAGGSSVTLLATADHVCFNLERLQAQNRSPAFAVRVVWNESLGDLPSEDVAAFGVVFNAAPQYLCIDSIVYGEQVAYWLGI
jgi:hypothetical protein